MPPVPLPIDDFIPAIQDAVRRARAAVIVAAPGAGKTTRVPPALAADGRVLVLQPRRIAARTLAARVAEEQGWTLGGEVGWHVRFERRFGPRTRVLFATEGILTARLQQDPLLSDVRTIVLDEFHERSVHADLGIALARQAWLARDDVRLVVMSATIDAGAVSAFLGDCPVIDVPGRTHPVTIDYAPGQPLADAVRDVAARSAGSVLCFLPGAPEIQRAIADVQRAMPAAEVLPLHGSLEAADQERAVRPASSPPRGSGGSGDGGRDDDGSGRGDVGRSDVARSGSGRADARRRIILATNIAETSLTVPGVTAVIDTGLHKVARYDSARGIDSLELERISQAAADQRAGRAGRLSPGLARRLWSPADRLRPHREPDIMRIDLAAPLLDLLAWGGDPDTFEWFEAPPAEAIDAALRLLRQLGAIEAAGRALTPIGRQLQAWPLHPRLGRILLAAGGSRDAARVGALLAERQFLPPRHELTTCDLFAALDDWPRVPPHIRQVSRHLEDLAARVSGDAGDGRGDARDARDGRDEDRAGGAEDLRSIQDARDGVQPGGQRRQNGAHADARDAHFERAARAADGRRESAGPHAHGGERPDEAALRRALLAGYPDRVARRREPGSPRVLLASGHGAALARESGVQAGEFLLALDVQAAPTVVSSAATAGLGGGALRVRPPAPGLDAAAAEARIRIASVVSRDWLRPTRTETVHWLDAGTGRVKAARRDFYESIVLSEHPQAPDPVAAAPLLAEAYLAREPREADVQLARRLAFAGLPLDLRTLVLRATAAAAALGGSGSRRGGASGGGVRTVAAGDVGAALVAGAGAGAAAGARPGAGPGRSAAAGAAAGASGGGAAGSVGGAGGRGLTLSLEAMDLPAQLTWDESRELDRRAPETLRVPSGRTTRLEYEEDGGVSASVKLQELFGLADTPRVGIAPRQAPVLLKLLAPNGRPVQTTMDLRSFWDRTYPEVRKELRGRYPKHPWPDDPWSATPTARTTRRPRTS